MNDSEPLERRAIAVLELKLDHERIITRKVLEGTHVGLGFVRGPAESAFSRSEVSHCARLLERELWLRDSLDALSQVELRSELLIDWTLVCRAERDQWAEGGVECAEAITDPQADCAQRVVRGRVGGRCGRAASGVGGGLDFGKLENLLLRLHAGGISSV